MAKIIKPSFKFTSYTLGLISELYAIFFLILKGYKILNWRYKTKIGEIDIIAIKKNIIHIIEVKYRNSQIDLNNLIQPKQIKRIKNAYLLFSKANKYHELEINLDLITIMKFGKITHYNKFFL